MKNKTDFLKVYEAQKKEKISKEWKEFLRKKGTLTVTFTVSPMDIIKGIVILTVIILTIILLNCLTGVILNH